jgi:predicted Zn-dependent peptidase
MSAHLMDADTGERLGFVLSVAHLSVQSQRLLIILRFQVLPPQLALKLPEIQKRTLSNGLPVWIVPLHKVPVVHVTLVVKSGAGADPRGKYGIAGLTADMLDEGAGRRNALQIADAIDYLGASLSTSSTSDASFLELHVPVARLGEALPIMADVALHPTFPQEELQRVREELLTSIVQAEDDPEALIQFAFPRLVYGPQHRYGTMSFGTAASVKGFSVADLRQFHAQHYVPSNAAIIVTGDVTPAAAVSRVEAAFGTWKGASVGPAIVPEAPQLTARQIYLIDKPGSAQSQIRIGWVGVPRSTPDYFALRVLNTILGGSFTSRLNQNLREEHGYAYGASSNFDMRATPGPFVASANVQTDKTVESLREFFKELEGIHQPVPADELTRARNLEALGYPAGFETTSGMTSQLTTLAVYGLPESFFSEYVPKIQAVTAADIARAAKTYILTDRFAVVVVGDLSKIEQPIRNANLGPVKVVTADEILK